MTLTQVNLFGFLLCTGIAIVGVAFRFRRRFWSPRPAMVQSLAFDDSLVRVLLDGVEQDSFRWSDLNLVRAWRQDAFPIETIRVEFEVQNHSEPVCIQEFMEGFKPLMQVVERRCDGLVPDWWDRIAYPPCKENHVIVWTREGVHP